MAGTYRYQHGDKPVEGYTILRGIGRGGFGEVYYAMSDGGREVALKVIQQNHDIELRGVRHCINLKNPHLVSIFDVKKSSSGLPFVIMEYVAGPSLRDLLPREGHGVGAGKAAYLLREISRGLTYLHERGIVHRDLKPENIFYEDGYAKIGDYGLSKYISVSRQSGQTISVGTVHYMAPEIGSGNYHQGIDIYALGIIFYELLTGTVPFNGDSMGEILMKHLTMEPDVSILEEPFRPIVKKALAKNPIERYQTAKEMVDDVFSVPELAARVARVEPQSFVSQAASQATTAAQAELRGAETTPVPAPKAPAIPPPLPPPLAPPTSLPTNPGLPRPPNWSERLVPGIATAGAMALALGLLTPNQGPAAISGFFILLAGVAGGILGVEYWIAPRFRIATGTVRRIVTLGLVGPIFAGAVAILSVFRVSGVFADALPGLLAGLLFIDWSARARPSRTEQVSVGLAFSAGMFGLVAGAVTVGQRGVFPAAELLAALSFVVNAVSPFIPLSERRKTRPTPGNGRSRLETAMGLERTTSDSEIQLARGTPGSPTVVLSEPEATPRAQQPASSHRTKLIRPREGTVIGGVCAGIAQRLEWDVVLLRVAFAVLAFAGGTGLFLYVVFWMAMPAEPVRVAPPKPRKLRSARANPKFVPRPGWFGLSVLCFAVGVTIAYMAARSPRNVIAWILLNALGAVAILKGRSRRLEGATGVRASAVGSGWAAMGRICVTLAFMAAALHATAEVSGLDTYLVQSIRLDRNPRVADAFFGFFRGDASQVFAVVTFLLGVLFLLIARSWGGVVHVFRGVLGWAGLGTVAGILLISISRIVHVSPSEVIIDIPFNEGTLLAFAVLTAVSLFLLVWPGASATPEMTSAVPGTSEQAA